MHQVKEIAFLNGKWLPIEEAFVHIEDRGFQFGDSLYEVVRLYNGKLFRAEEHMTRLFTGLDFIGLEIPYTKKDLIKLFEEGAEKSQIKDGFVYLQATRGMAGARSHVITPGYKPTLVLTFRTVAFLTQEARENGLKSMTHPDWRWDKCYVKSTTLLPNILVRTKVARAGCYDAIQYREDGNITEGTVSNFFAVVNGTLRTHPKSDHILSGVSRTAVLEVARAAGIPVEERAIRVDEVYKASECFFSDTYSEVAPIVDVDGQKIGTGKAGPVTMAIYRGFCALVEKETGGK
jgi:D-alanine transaminase